jgi:hypothetical protein
MADMKYHVVKTDKGCLQIHFGSREPAKPPEDKVEAKQKAFREKWVPSTWEVLHTCDDEQSAEQKLEEELKNIPAPE